ncbi:hypothetical protein C1N62_15925 [Nissabacter sp. SGAir0207]|nr:hypothetical protein C1N62_15925 [Nissabacter sp. SGAir0207]
MECSKQAFFFKKPIAACAELPIMRLHRHGASDSLHRATGAKEKKLLKKDVDSERGKRNIRHLELASESA